MANNYFVNKLINEYEEQRNQAQIDCIKEYGESVLRDDLSFYNDTTGYLCPPYWDGLLCWGAASANTTLHLRCPPYHLGFNTTNYASRYCTEAGQWFVGNESQSWTNYTFCLHKGEIVKIFMSLAHSNISSLFKDNVEMIKDMSRTGYIVSFCTLVIAFAIMLLIKKLHCARNILHMHLFASFILRAFIFLVKDATFVHGIGLSADLTTKNDSLYFDINTENNNWLCKLMTSLWHYSRTANYSWILMEGLYLHNLIFRALFADSANSVKWYIVMGWGFPLIIMACWITARVMLDDALCWTMWQNVAVSLIIEVPTLTSILINFVIFLRISLVLFSKLRAPVNEDSQRYKKWGKSTLVLVPLFGVHYALFLLIFYYPMSENDMIKLVWYILDGLFASFQGFFVAILYCFLNGEVKAEIVPHLSYFLRFLAMNQYTRFLFPFRRKFLRSVVGRSSVCTTMSCSSLYTNGILHRNSKSRLDSISKTKQQSEKAASTNHVCAPKGLHDMSRRNSKNLHLHASQPFNVAETALCEFNYETAKSQSEPEISEEIVRILPPKEC